MKKVKTIIILGVVFILPCGWYLFLQAFGENRFELPKSGLLSDRCAGQFSNAVMALYESSIPDEFPNEWSRMVHFSAGNKIGLLPDSTCLKPNEILLVDANGYIRGAYFCSREETDRMLTEIDILIHYE